MEDTSATHLRAAALQRVTTEYVADEDRIRLAGETDAGETVVLWLTRRLLDLLVPHLTGWLAQRQGELPRADLLLSFAQQQAASQLVPQPPVAAADTARQWLVKAVDVQPAAETLNLNLRDDDNAVVFGMAATPLRQWLGILKHAYVAAGWPQDCWPAWMAEDQSIDVASVVLH